MSIFKILGIGSCLLEYLDIWKQFLCSITPICKLCTKCVDSEQ